MPIIRRLGEDHANIIVRNKLSKKPQAAITKITNYVENKLLPKGTWHDLGVSQNYSSNVVTLDLMTNATGEVVQTRKIPVTSSTKKYLAAIREMIKKEEDNKKLRQELDLKKEYNSLGNKTLRVLDKVIEFFES